MTDRTVQTKSAQTQPGYYGTADLFTGQDGRQDQIENGIPVVHDTSGQPQYRDIADIGPINMEPGNTGAPYETTLAPASCTARGVTSSGSTDIPPVTSIIWAPSPISVWIDSFIFSMSSGTNICLVTLQPQASSFLCSTGPICLLCSRRKPRCR
jgi:hypothetical protein